MATASVAVQIPQSLYHRLERAAVRLQKPVRDLLVETLQVVLPPADELSPDIQAEIAALADLGEAELRAVAQSEMASREQRVLDCLLNLSSARPLVGDEAVQLEKLRAEYGRVLIRKARAFALLAERGHPLPLA